MKKYFKDRFATIFRDVKKSEFIYWWILRALMIYALFDTIFSGSAYSASNPPIQIAANLVGMFAYEIIQFLPGKKLRLKFMSPRFQNITALGFLLGSFGGAYLNFYYSIPGYDKILHALGTAEAVYIGYEYVCATQIKFKKTCPHQIANLCALGLGFVFSSAWEVFEFMYDTYFGGDAQHWSYQLALEAAGGDASKIFNLFPVGDPSRFALMDTMGDIVLNFIGGFIMYAILCLIPYNHKGERNINNKVNAGNKT